VDLHQAYSDLLQVPSFLSTTPEGHFAGVSSPCPDLSEARKSAILDVVRQVLGSIGSTYGFESKHYVMGNARGEGLRRTVEESLSGTARGIVLDVEKNIVKSTWSKDLFGKFIYFVLVRYPQKMTDEMRRLSKGTGPIATVVPNADADGINLKVSEVNDVSVILTSADIIIRQHNRFAKPISLFLWKVPPMIEHNFSIPIDPVKICGNSANIRIPMDTLGKSLIDYLLGSHFEKIVTLKGYDEIGRAVSVKIGI
jgi:hypothetical protein